MLLTLVVINNNGFVKEERKPRQYSDQAGLNLILAQVLRENYYGWVPSNERTGEWADPGVMVEYIAAFKDENGNVVAQRFAYDRSKKPKRHDGQTTSLPKIANVDPRTTHVAINKQHGVRYFCRFDPTEIHPQDGIPDDQVKGTYWITPCPLYGTGYNEASLWQGGFTFIPLAEYND
jgi:hypothetical protein